MHNSFSVYFEMDLDERRCVFMMLRYLNYGIVAHKMLICIVLFEGVQGYIFVI